MAQNEIKNNDKKSKNTVLYIIIGAIAIPTILFVGFFNYNLTTLGNSMKVGQKFMENLTDNDLIYWIEDATLLHSNDSLKTKGVRAKSKQDNSLEEKYTKHGIIRIDVRKNSVTYVWMGGFDHTGLVFDFAHDTVTKVIAAYNDYTRQILYPELGKVHFDKEYPKMKKYKGNMNLTGTIIFKQLKTKI